MNRRDLLITAVGTTGTGTGAASAQAPNKADQATASPWTARGAVPRGGGVIGYAIAGPATGNPLVFLSKLGGWIQDWSPLARELANDHRLIAIDPPGHGSSLMTTEPPQVQTLSESAAAVRAALEELGIDSCTVIGNSLGGCIAATLAARWPSTVGRLVLISTAVPPRDSLAQILADEAKTNPPIYDAAGNPLPRSAATASARFGMSPALAEEMNRSRAAAGRWIRASERGVRREGLTELLPRITAPTLLIYSDSGTYLRHRITAQRLLPAAKLTTIAGAGSFVHQERPTETAQAIRAFLRA